MIEFKTSIDKSLLGMGRNRLVIHSSHLVTNNKLMNMFSGPGSPMLDVADAIVLRNMLNEFINSEVKHNQ